MVDEVAACLYAIYDSIKSKGDVFKVPQAVSAGPGQATATRRTWMVTSYPAILRALDNPDLTSDRSGILLQKLQREFGAQLQDLGQEITNIQSILSNMLINLDGPRHTKLRQIHILAFNSYFDSGGYAALRELLAQEAERLIRDARRHYAGEVDLLQVYARPLISYLNLTLLGVDPSRKGGLEDSLGKVAAMLPGNVGFNKSKWTEGMAGADELKSLFQEAVEEHRKGKPASDLLGAFVAQGELDELELIGMCFLVARATEGAANLIGNGTLALLLHPQELQKLEEDPQLTGAAVNELLRFTPPVEFIPRKAEAATRIEDQSIEKDDVVILNIGVANRCNGYIDSPEQLNIQRKCNLVFGHGLHECLGQNLARLVGEVAISVLLKEAGPLKLVRPETLNWIQAPENPDGLRGLEALPVELAARASA